MARDLSIFFFFPGSFGFIVCFPPTHSTCSPDHVTNSGAKSQAHGRTDHGTSNPPTSGGTNDGLSHSITDQNANSTAHHGRTDTASIHGQADGTTCAGTDRNSHLPTDASTHGIANPGTDFAHPRISHRAGICL